MHRVESRPPAIADRMHFSFKNVSVYGTLCIMYGILTVGSDKGRN
jgi:hypothetical protein